MLEQLKELQMKQQAAADAVVGKYIDPGLEAVLKIDEGSRVNAYATYLHVVSLVNAGLADENSLIDNLLHLDFAYDYMFRITKKALDDISELDRDFHLIHVAYPDIRKKAIRVICEEIGKWETVTTPVKTSDPEKVEVAKRKIEKAVSHLDLSLVFRETYNNDHRRRAMGFRDEFLLVDIWAIDQDTAEQAVKLIKDLDFD